MIGPYRVSTSTEGLLEHLGLAPMDRRAPGMGEVEICVRATGVNFRDVLHALGLLPEPLAAAGVDGAAAIPFGFECAGEVVGVGAGVEHLRVGDDVIAAPAVGSLASFVTTAAAFVVRKPARLTFEDAATVPIAYLTALYGLERLANVRSGERVLIHAAAGGVGQAAVRVAQRAGANIFATASPAKWTFLQALGIEHVMSSRTLEFADQIMRATGGEGIDVVLNSFNGDFIPRTLDAVARAGRFIEIGKRGVWDPPRVRERRPDVGYACFDLWEAACERPQMIAELLATVAHDLEAGTLAPLPYTVFPVRDVVAAFRHMAKAKHIGKIVIRH